MKRALVLTCLTTALWASLASSATAGTAPRAPTERLGSLDQGVLAEVNQSRVEHGLRRLVISNDLQQAAGMHSKQMLDGGFFAHDAPGGTPFAKRVRGFYQSDGYRTWSVGENLLYSTGEITAAMAVEAWLNSPEHRENMLSPAWREVGVAALRTRIARGAFGGKATWVITMDFGARTGKALASSSAAASLSTNSRVSPVTESLAWFGRRPEPARSAKKQTVTRVLPGGSVTQPV